jgi:hypothetical protein
MRLIGRLIVGVLVLGAFSMWLMHNGHWPGILSATEQIAGKPVADKVDQFGQTSKLVGDDAIRYFEGLYDKAKSGEPIEIDWGGLGDVIDEIGKPKNERVPTYVRKEFGDGWLDLDGDGCDTRNEILNRDLTQVVLHTDGCKVLSGVLDDPYTGKSIQFTRGADTSSDVQIDHVVSLSAAWHSGAWAWSRSQREAFASDPLNLIAVDGPTNTSKGNKGVSGWTPPNADFQCSYVAIYIAVHHKYDLAMSNADRKAAGEKIAVCN